MFTRSTPETRLLLGLVASLALVLVSLPAAAQLPGSMSGKIFDENSEPVAGVVITVTDPERPGWSETFTSRKNGMYKVFLTSSLPSYTFAFAKEGYQSFSLNGVKIQARQEIKRNWDIKSQDAAVAAAQAAGQVAPELSEADIAKGNAMKSFNAAVQAFNGGDTATAIEGFKAAIEKNPELGIAYAGLARAQRAAGNHQQAVEAAERAVGLETDVGDMNQILFDAHSALGNKEEANAALSKLTTGDPAKAALNLFNQAADMFNSGDMEGAIAGFEKVLAVDPDHPKANYMIGTALSGSDPARAKTHLEKFLAVAPSDPDAEVAKQMIEYLK